MPRRRARPSPLFPPEPAKRAAAGRFYLWFIPLFFVLHWFGARWIACASGLGFIVLVFIASTLDEIAERLKERQP